MLLRKLAIYSSLLVPEKILDNNVAKWLQYAGSKDNKRIWIGTRIFLSLLMGLIGFLIPFSIIPLVNLFLETKIYFTPLTGFISMLSLGLILCN
jgi:hypothetical protein